MAWIRKTYGVPAKENPMNYDRQLLGPLSVAILARKPWPGQVPDPRSWRGAAG